jgi:hypothetical protein
MCRLSILLLRVVVQGVLAMQAAVAAVGFFPVAPTT